MMAITTDFAALSASLGAMPLAANSLLLQLQMLISFGADGFANAVESLVGQAVGAHNYLQLRAAVVSGLKWCVLLAFGYSVVYALAGQVLLKALTSHSD